jgi:hypothetical protein
VKKIKNVDPEMYNYTGSKWSHRSSDERFKGKFGAVPGNHSIDPL